MIIHECADIDTSGNGNIYMLELYKHLLRQKSISKIYSGTYFLEHPVMVPDVMHIHWPEQITGYHEPATAQLVAIERELKKARHQHTKICYTVHNLQSHMENEKFARLYRMILSYADALIHFSNYSVNAVKQLYQSSIPTLATIPHVVIPHGNYLSHKNDISPSAARKLLKISDNEQVIIVFGALRHKQEIDFILQAFNHLPIADKKLIIAGKNYTSVNIADTDQVFVYNRVVSPAQIQIFMNAADILILPRYNTLNSGLPYLGFSFGKVVAGPNVGTIGELLNATHNFVFDPENPLSVWQAISDGLAASKTTLGHDNKIYAATTCNWDNIASLHFQLFKNILS